MITVCYYSLGLYIALRDGLQGTLRRTEGEEYASIERP